MKIMMIILTIIFMGCNFGPLKGVDTIESGNPDNSSLSSLLSTTGVLPPKNLKKEINIAQGIYKITLFWDSAANVNNYKVSLYNNGVAEFEDQIVNTPQYYWEITLSDDEDNYVRELTVKCVNINGIESLASKPFKIEISRVDTYNETISQAYLSRGTSTSIEVIWSRAKDADYYKIFRELTSNTNKDNRVLVNSKFLPSSDKPQYKWSDSTVEEGRLYNYVIVPVNIQGILGVEKIAEKGFILPLPKNVKASAGSTVFNSGSPTKTVIDITFDMVDKFTKAENALVEDEELLAKFMPKNIDVFVSLNPSNILSSGISCSSLLSGIDTTTNNRLRFLSKYDETNTSFATPPGYEKVTYGSNIFWTKAIESENKKSYLFRVIVRGISGSEPGFSAANIWGNPMNDNVANQNLYYFVIKTDYDLASDLPTSQIVTGWATANTNKDVSTTVTASINSPNNALVSWTAISGATKYFVYQKKESDGGWTFKETVTAPNTSVELKVDNNSKYYFGVTAIKNGNQEYMQSPLSEFGPISYIEENN